MVVACSALPSPIPGKLERRRWSKAGQRGKAHWQRPIRSLQSGAGKWGWPIKELEQSCSSEEGDPSPGVPGFQSEHCNIKQINQLPSEWDQKRMVDLKKISLLQILNQSQHTWDEKVILVKKSVP